MKQSTVRRILITAAALVAAGVILRAILPVALTHYVNDQFEQMGEYRGHVEDIDLSVIRGAYVLRNLTIVKESTQAEQPFLRLPHADISVEWGELFDGELVGEIQLHQPVMNMVQGETSEETQLGTGVNWPDQVRKLFPFRFNRVEIMGGRLTFRAPGIDTDESLTLHSLNVLLNNLTNVEDRKEPSFAEFDVQGLFAKDTPLAITGHIDPNARQPTFDVNMALEGARLVEVNPWLEEFLNVDAERGVFSMYTELATADGRFKGYIKPILEDAEFFSLDEPSDGLLQKAWEGLVGMVAAILTNPEEDQIATQLPFSGELDDPDAEILSAVVNLLRNAFVAAFTHSIEGTVDIEDVE
ncbi:MAG TPA: DUF748 domain-containing protein [Woeseiaceae bacterium]